MYGHGFGPGGPGSMMCDTASGPAGGFHSGMLPFAHSGMTLLFFAAVGIAIWFFATGRHRKVEASGSVAAVPAPVAYQVASVVDAPLDPAEEIVRERFARGEITAEEYRVAIETLRLR